MPRIRVSLETHEFPERWCRAICDALERQDTEKGLEAARRLRKESRDGDGAPLLTYDRELKEALLPALTVALEDLYEPMPDPILHLTHELMRDLKVPPYDRPGTAA